MKSLRFLVASAALALGASVSFGQTPLLQYTFDDAGPGVVDTGSGTPANGTLEGGAVRSTNTPTGTGFAIDFNNDAPNAHVLEGDAAKLDGLNQLTLTTWLNVAAFPGSAGPGVTNSSNKRLLSKQDVAGGGFTFNMNSAVNDGSAGANDFKVGLFLGGTGGSGFTFATSTADVDANTISAENHWVFLAVSYDGTLASDNTRFYIGDTSTSLTQLGATQTLGQVAIDAGAGRFGVGFTDAASGFDFSVNGLQDDVRVYGEALSLAQLEVVRLQNVPEPASLSLLALAGVAGLRRRRRDRRD